jgi:hypothetical protein
MSGRPDPGHALRWPAGFSPEWSDAWARSELVVAAAPPVVFSRLIAVRRWERDFPGIRDVRVPAPGRGYLEPDGVFGFELDGLRLSAQVIEFAAGRRLAWSGQGIDISTYHAWVLSGDPGGTRVLAGFAARGAAAIALREPDPAAPQRALDRWVAALKAASMRADGTSC